MYKMISFFLAILRKTEGELNFVVVNFAMMIEQFTIIN